MIDPQEAAEAGAIAAADVLRAVQQYAPGATNIQIRTVNHYGDKLELIDFRADLPDGSELRSPRLVINRR